MTDFQGKKCVAGPDGPVAVDLTPEEEAQRIVDADAAAAENIIQDAERAKTKTYEDDTTRKTFWDNVDTMTKDEFVSFVDGFITNQDTAKTAIVRLALEVGRLRRKVG